MGDMFLDNEMSELHQAAYHGELEWACNCLAGGLDVNARDKGGWTPLHWAADMGVVEGEREEIVSLLIRSGADVRARDDVGESVVFRAITAGNMAIVRLLIAAGADVTVPDNRGSTPLKWATANEVHEVAAFIRSVAGTARAS